MDLTHCKCVLRLSFLTLFLASLTTTGLAQPAQICINQSPRQVTFDLKRLDQPAQGKDFNFVSGTPVVNADSLTPVKVHYQGRNLELCDRHYHVPVENIQHCAADERVDQRPDHTGPPRPGQWIEVHNVYALEVSHEGVCETGHDHGLVCCAKPPFVVVGYSARIDTTATVPPTATNFAEWAGSATSEDPATLCNSTPAEWHFGLTCSTRYTQQSLQDNVGGAPHKARVEQPPNRISSDLTFVGPNNQTAVCREVATDAIATPALAQRICPGVCKWPLNSWNTQWRNTSPSTAVCGCCPLDRPQ
jgi:hypothetical protein